MGKQNLGKCGLLVCANMCPDGLLLPFVCLFVRFLFSVHLVKQSTIVHFNRGSYRSSKTWKVMEFEISFSRPGKSWNLSVGHGKPRRMMLINKLVFFFTKKMGKDVPEMKTIFKKMVKFRSWKTGRSHGKS